MTHSTHVAPSAMSIVLSPLSGSRWRMVFQISSSESTSLSLVLFCPALRSIPASTCSRDVATTAPRMPVYDPEGRLFVVDIVCYLLGYAHHLRLSFKENLLHHFLVLLAQQVAVKDGHYLIACFLRVTMRSRIDAEFLHARDQRRSFDPHKCRGSVLASYSPACDF